MFWKKKAIEVRANNARRMKIEHDTPIFGERDRERTEADFRRMERFYWLALAGEVGEGCNLVKKQWRDGPRWNDERRNANLLACYEELADVRIYCEALADLYGIDLDEVCDRKMQEVASRPFAQKV